MVNVKETIKSRQMEGALTEKRTDQGILVRKRVGGTTFLVRVHFNETSKGTFQDKVERMVMEDIRREIF